MNFNKAKVKFDGGNLAILCNRCDYVIGSYANTPEDKEYLCSACIYDEQHPESPGSIVAYQDTLAAALDLTDKQQEQLISALNKARAAYWGIFT